MNDAPTPPSPPTAPATEEREEIEQQIEAERTETVEEDPTMAPGHGAKRFVDALQMALLTVMCLVDDMTPESPYSKIGFNTTADAQTMRKAPKKYRTSSTALLRLLEKHFAPYVNQALAIARSGLDADLLLPMPAWYWVRDGDRGPFRRVDLASSTSKTNMQRYLRVVARAPRETLRQCAERLHPGIKKKKYAGKIGEIGYDARSFMPAVNGDLHDALDGQVSDEWTLVRLPVVPELFDRDVNSIWDAKTFGRLEQELAMCLNNALKKKLDGWYRKLLSVDTKGNFIDIALSGSDVKILDEWEECFAHWGKAMKAGYTLKATDADRATCEQVRLEEGHAPWGRRHEVVRLAVLVDLPRALRPLWVPFSTLSRRRRPRAKRWRTG